MGNVFSAGRGTRALATGLLVVCGCAGPSASGDAALTTDGSTAIDAASSDDATTPTFSCAALSDPTQCWNRLVSALHACVPTEVGVLDAARTECTYADGTVVRFAAAVPTSGNYEPRFTILRPDGSTCGTFDSGGLSLGVITSGTSTASLSQETGPTLRLACDDDGVATTAFDVPYSDLGDCTGAAEPVVPPGYDALIDATTVRIRLIADGDNASPSLVDCAGP